jgi:putative heme-binding domain-containing protein
MRACRLEGSIAILAVLCMLEVAVAQEAWTDSRLNISAGVELWLDADSAAAAAVVSGKKSPADGGRLPLWRDGSGLRRDVSQVDPKRQPTLVRVGDSAAAEAGWVVRFDGEDDYLRGIIVGRRLSEFTLFVVAAPHSNLGQYRAFLSLNEPNRKDYETGLNLDLNAQPSVAFANLNLEGKGFGGARNLLKTTVPFGTLHILEAISDLPGKQIRVAIDGQAGGSRPLAGSELAADEVTIGARHLGDGSGPGSVQGFFQGDLAEILLYNRTLTVDEVHSVRGYLRTKHAALVEALPRQLAAVSAAANIEPLVAVTEAPLVQMLIPGFTVSEVPVELTNINNLRYRPDGQLYALAYNGDVWLLRDADGDGLPDTKGRFFENKSRLRGPIGLAVIPPGHALLRDDSGKPQSAARGIVVASKGKVSALLDNDGDDVAEMERVIATGWKEIPQNVDAIGVAIHPNDGAIYFGLGTAAYNNAYLLDGAGKSAFDLASDRGTIQRIEPDLSRRTTVCTGVRFTIGMEFNAHKQLIVTEQEGATWLPNGNPFDELLHILPGRHYGFPPRHPRHLPRVFDEPSLFDYGPQHQSACGMIFNLPLVAGGPIFGPASWRGDAIVCGQSRGKLYRTKLIKDQLGEYVAQNQLIGCLGMLTVDCCLTPRGDLLVACHSGGPDWGTGPSGIGKIFLIRYEGNHLPQPTTVWPAGPQEVRIAFDRPLDPQSLRNLASESKIIYGEFVAAGDRFETIRPGYAVTQLQQSKPRHRLPIYAASVTPDRKTLILATAPHPAAANYSLTLPGLGRKSDEHGSSVFPQHPQIDLAYSLQGVAATWEPHDRTQPVWTGWLPHLDLAVARQLNATDPEAARLWDLLEQPGTLNLATQVNPRGLFLPIVQPGSQLDYNERDDTWVIEQSLQFVGDRPFSVSVANADPASKSNDQHRLSLPLSRQSPLPIALRIETGGRLPVVRPAWTAKLADGQSRSGSLALHRMIVPWASFRPEDQWSPRPREIPELASANWGRGRQVFLSEDAGCAKCHLADRAGSRIGPDLANLIHRDYASVLRDITQPSFAINPDFITYVASLHDGRVLTGAHRSEGEQLLIGDKEGKLTAVLRSEVDELKPSPLSIMPDGIPAKLGPDKTKDLLAYLLHLPPRMPSDCPLPPPKPRTPGEVAAILAGSELPATNVKPLHLLLVAGKKDHGPGEHDYPAWLVAWSQLLSAAPGVTVSAAMEWPSDEQFRAADTIVFYQRGSWNAQRAIAIDAHLAKGGGLVYLHWAVEGASSAPEFAERIGLASNAAQIKYRHGPLDLDFRASQSHPIARNFSRAAFYDESYWLLPGEVSRVRVLATGVEQGEPRPLFWTVEPGRGRVFVSIPGHYSWTFDDPLFRILLLRSLAWTAHEPVDRFNELVTLGATLAGE